MKKGHIIWLENIGNEELLNLWSFRQGFNKQTMILNRLHDWQKFSSLLPILILVGVWSMMRRTSGGAGVVWVSNS
jgi:hypothetical protein